MKVRITRKRRFLNRTFESIIRISSLVPVILLVIMILSVLDWSMGTALRVDDTVLRQWTLSGSLFDRNAVLAEARSAGEKAELFFRFGPSLKWIFSRSEGIESALVGSFWIVLFGILLGFPLAMVTALWLDHSNRLASEIPVSTKIVRLVLAAFARIPYVLYGVFVLTVLTALNLRHGGLSVRNLGNASILMGIIALPRLTMMMEREIAEVPQGIRGASYALGATWAAVVFRQVLPASFGFILTGTLKMTARLLGLASPFVVLGTPIFLNSLPMHPGDRFITMPVQIFQWALRPDGIYRNLAASAAVTLLILVFGLEIVSNIWRRRLIRRREGLR